VIDGASDAVIATVATGGGAGFLCYNLQNNRVYCSNYDSANVSVIDGASDTVIATVLAGNGASVLCYNPQNNKVYCANYDGANVTVIDGAADTVIATVPTGSTPTFLCYNATNNKVYCANYDSSNVTVIDGATNGIVTTITVGGGPLCLTWNPAQNRVYVANEYDSTISVIRDSIPSGVEEMPNAEVRAAKPVPTIARGVLFLAEARSRKPQAASLLDISGRKVLDLKPGANDVRALAPGVYFIREGLGIRGEGLGKTQKVVVTR
jgi:YVTN family beta-propeller protein